MAPQFTSDSKLNKTTPMFTNDLIEIYIHSPKKITQTVTLDLVPGGGGGTQVKRGAAP